MFESITTPGVVQIRVEENKVCRSMSIVASTVVISLNSCRSSRIRLQRHARLALGRYRSLFHALPFILKAVDGMSPITAATAARMAKPLARKAQKIVRRAAQRAVTQKVRAIK